MSTYEWDEWGSVVILADHVPEFDHQSEKVISTLCRKYGFVRRGVRSLEGSAEMVRRLLDDWRKCLSDSLCRFFSQKSDRLFSGSMMKYLPFGDAQMILLHSGELDCAVFTNFLFRESFAYLPTPHRFSSSELVGMTWSENYCCVWFSGIVAMTYRCFCLFSRRSDVDEVGKALAGATSIEGFRHRRFESIVSGFEEIFEPTGVDWIDASLSTLRAYIFAEAMKR